MTALFINSIQLILFLILVVIGIYYHIKIKRFKRTTGDLLTILDNHIDILDELNKKKDVSILKNMIELYSNMQIILKISNANYISLFKYDYSKRYIMSHFLFSMLENGNIEYATDNDKLPITSDLLKLNIFKTDDKELYYTYIKDVNGITQDIKDKQIKKCYYQNIFNDSEKPFAFIIISYKDENYNILDGDKEEILRILQKIKSLI